MNLNNIINHFNIFRKRPTANKSSGGKTKKGSFSSKIDSFKRMTDKEKRKEVFYNYKYSARKESGYGFSQRSRVTNLNESSAVEERRTGDEDSMVMEGTYKIIVGADTFQCGIVNGQVQIVKVE